MNDFDYSDANLTLLLPRSVSDRIKDRLHALLLQRFPGITASLSVRNHPTEYQRIAQVDEEQ